MQKGQLHLGRRLYKSLPSKFFKILSVAQTLALRFGSNQSFYLQLQH